MHHWKKKSAALALGETGGVRPLEGLAGLEEEELEVAASLISWLSICCLLRCCAAASSLPFLLCVRKYAIDSGLIKDFGEGFDSSSDVDTDMLSRENFLNKRTSLCSRAI